MGRLRTDCTVSGVCSSGACARILETLPAPCVWMFDTTEPRQIARGGSLKIKRIFRGPVSMHRASSCALRTAHDSWDAAGPLCMKGMALAV